MRSAKLLFLLILFTYFAALGAKAPLCVDLFRQDSSYELTTAMYDHKIEVLGPRTEGVRHDEALKQENEGAKILAKFGFLVTQNPGSIPSIGRTYDKIRKHEN